MGDLRTASRIQRASHLIACRLGELVAQEEGAICCLDGQMEGPRTSRSSGGRVLPFPSTPPEWKAYEAQKYKRRATVLREIFRQWRYDEERFVGTVIDVTDTWRRMDHIMELYKAKYPSISTWMPWEITEMDHRKTQWSKWSAYELGFADPPGSSTSSALSLLPGPDGAAAAAVAEPAAGLEG